jgi:hypothetical protein
MNTDTQPKYGKIISVNLDDSIKIDGDIYQCITIETEFGSKVIVGISDFQTCCERYGLGVHTTETEFLSDKSPNLNGLNLISVKWGHNPIVSEYDDMCCALVNLTVCSDSPDTTRIVQIVAFNEHNGYYPHDVYVKWLDHEETQSI